MSPYEILGIRPTASLDEAEAAYRALLREFHPDLHLQAGPEAVAWAEQRTRQLNAAIHTLRTRDRVFAGTARDPYGPNDFRVADATDWFGNRTRTHFDITCVVCGAAIGDPTAYRVHLVLDHAFAERLRKRSRIGRPPRLTLIPAPMFWALMVLMVYWACIFSTLGDSSLAIAGWWLGIVAYLVFLPFAYRAVRYRRRF
jgi:hypothetical protein